LATVVRVRGSSYRSPGARMLITSDGRWVGSISGGCLEGDALRKARQVMNDQKPMTVTYDTSEESNQNLGISLGCNGIIDVLIEPLDGGSQSNPVLFFKEFNELQEPVGLATIFSENEIGEKFLITEQGINRHHFSNENLNVLVNNDLQDVFNSKRSEARSYLVNGIHYDMFIELIQPSINLIIFGGGADARPVSQLAKALGWKVEVTDECVAHIAPAFFPDADKLSLCHREFIDRDFIITPYTACLLMSHNYEYDRDVLKKLLRSPAHYIGIMGPRKRVDKMEAEFNKEGFSFSSEDNSRIHAPVGLDIGAEASHEIAVSIVAEIQSKFSSRPGGFLKNRIGTIHQRGASNDQVFKQAYLGNEN
jgi:xanthine dehydrogenase accessory factor